MSASGTTTVDFGAFPGSTEVTVDVTGQTGFVAASECSAWVQPIATADHSVDEHTVENIEAWAYYQADGTIRINVRVKPFFTQFKVAPQAHRLHGIFTIGWAWA